MSNRYDRDPADRQPPAPKPYAFVPLSERRLSRPVGHDRFVHHSGTIRAVLIAHSPVHVASGLLKQENDRRYPLVKAHFRSAGLPTIPATSLKGCIRSIVEAISPSSVGITRARPMPRQAELSQSLDNLDVTQRLFGALGYQGQIRFSDAVLQSGSTTIVMTPQLFRPRSEAISTYFDGSRVRGRKFYMHGELAGGNLPVEACPIDSRLPFRIDFENLSAGEIGLMLVAIGQATPRLYPKLGGAKPACLGTVEVTDVEVTLLDVSASYTSFEPANATYSPHDLIQAAFTEGWAIQERLDQLAEVLRWPREDRSCPIDPY